ncbi:MAG: hemN [Ilumatobacteraceae bacterium]|nr:hemN [Ilumatobacteraceae bacterium]
MAVSQPFGVYVHIPFCAKRCDYCAFATWTDRHHLEGAYLQALRDDIVRSMAQPASTIFVGGGTPTMVDPHALASVIAAIPRTADAEITVECNPDDVTVDMLRAYRDAGVNRVSIGVQSMVPSVLASLGRWHVPDNVVRAVEAVKAVEMPTWNMDLIYGGAGESLTDWEHTVTTALALEPPHISAYALTVEAGTPLAAQPERHPDDDDLADKYELADDLFVAAGRVNYEVSNWSLPGHESQHNRLYWLQGNYLGFGAAAHSHEDGRRWWNVRTPERYIDAVRSGLPTEAAGETLDAATRRDEGLQLALRMREGVPVEALDADGLDDLVTTDGVTVKLTRRGRLLANQVSLRLR